MIEDRDQAIGGSSQDPEERAFTGGADTPPEQPDHPAERNRELLRDDEQDEADKPAEAPPGGDNPHGDYPSLPGYGG